MEKYINSNINNIGYNKKQTKIIKQKDGFNYNIINKSKTKLIKTIILNLLIIIKCFNIVFSLNSTSLYRKLQTIQKIKLKVLFPGSQEIIYPDYINNLQV